MIEGGTGCTRLPALGDQWEAIPAPKRPVLYLGELPKDREKIFDTQDTQQQQNTLRWASHDFSTFTGSHNPSFISAL